MPQSLHTITAPVTGLAPVLNALPAKRLAVAGESRARAAASWLLLIIRRLDKPVGPEAIEIMGRLIELAMIDAQDMVQNLRRLQTQLSSRI